MTKRNGIYYLVYSDMSRKGMPTCIGYATSTSPMGPYTYRGVIVDNDGCDPTSWNNHGSIVEFNNQWYVFYHRTTNGVINSRKACIEPIFFNADGSIDEVEMTSQGAGKPLNAFSKIEAERSCLMFGNVRIEYLSYDETNPLGTLEIPGGGDGKTFTKLTTDIRLIYGVHALYMEFEAAENESLSVDWLMFNK